MVQRMLNDDQMEHCMQVCQDIIKYFQNKPDLLQSVISSDMDFCIKPRY